VPPFRINAAHTAAELEATLRSLCTGSLNYYGRYHLDRYAYLIELVRRLLEPIAAPRILDVGPMQQTELFRALIEGATVDTLGFFPWGEYRSGETHVTFDLERLRDGEAGPPATPHDLVVAAEIVEHLNVPPSTTLAYLRHWLAPDGWLVVQTPNAVSLRNRLKMIRGHHPAPMLNGRKGPEAGHVREYTLAELRWAGAEAGFQLEGAEGRNYFQFPGQRRHRRVLYELACRPARLALADGLTVWFRNAPD
jgi:hypothetical protein